MTPDQTAAASLDAAYYEHLSELNVVPLWRLDDPVDPAPFELPHVWRYDALVTELTRASTAVGLGPGAANRRVLTLRNPGLPYGIGASQTITAALQMVLPGEVAPAHRHSYNALRFIIDSEGAATVVDGTSVRMGPRDLVTTPGWAWHDHRNEGSSPALWFDVLDYPLAFSLRTAFYQDYPGRASQPVDGLVAPTEPRFGAGLLPGGSGGATANPMSLYSWEAMATALDAAGSLDGTSVVEYLDPATGGSVLPTIDARVERYPAGHASTRRRRTAGEVFIVIDGGGSFDLGGSTLRWARGDIVTVPAWTESVLSVIDGVPALLLVVSDRPTQQAIGMYREEGDLPSAHDLI